MSKVGQAGAGVLVLFAVLIGVIVLVGGVGSSTTGGNGGGDGGGFVSGSGDAKDFSCNVIVVDNLESESIQAVSCVITGFRSSCGSTLAFGLRDGRIHISDTQREIVVKDFDFGENELVVSVGGLDGCTLDGGVLIILRDSQGNELDREGVVLLNGQVDGLIITGFRRGG